MYGPFTNEELVGRGDRGPPRRRSSLATKFGIVRDRDDPARRGVNGRPEYVRQACEALAAAARASTTSTSTTSTASTRRRRSRRPSARWPSSCSEGKVRYLGLSEAGARRRSAGPTPCIRSPRCRPSTRSGRATRRTRSCRPAASWASASSPTARSAAASSPARSSRFDDLAADDYRRALARASRARTSRRTSTSSTGSRRSPADEGRARRRSSRSPGCWRQGDDIVPIPGTKRRRRLEENAGAVDVALSAEDLRGSPRRSPRPRARATTRRACERQPVSG